MAKWFVLDEIDVRGPFTPSELLGMVRRGTITRETKLRKDDSGWFPANDVGGLFEAAVKPTVVLRCPGCEAAVSKVPCTCPNCGRHLEDADRELIQNKIHSPNDVPPIAGMGATMQRWLKKIGHKD